MKRFNHTPVLFAPALFAFRAVLGADLTAEDGGESKRLDETL